jgi:hypothetical protein
VPLPHATALLILAALSGCSAAQRQAAQARRAEAALSEAASTYWDAVRWGDVAAALTFVRSTEGKRALSAQLGDGPPRRVTEVQPVEVTVEKDEQTGMPEHGTVLVRVSSFDTRRGRVEQDLVEQRWRYKDRTWRIDEFYSPIDPDRPW